MIFVSISNTDTDSCLVLVSQYKNVELRLDLIKPDIDDIGLLIAGTENSICTYRDLSEPDKAYEYTLKSVELGADIIDYGLENSFEMIRSVVSAARSKNKKVILSYHNFEGYPGDGIIDDIIIKAERYSPDLIKMAVLVSNEEESEKMLALMNKKDNIIPVTMGEAGKNGRLKAYHYGCPIVYAHPDGELPTAPGQLSFSEYKDTDKIVGLILR